MKISSIIQALLFIKTLPDRSEQEKKRQKIYDLLDAENKPKNLITSIKEHANELKAHMKTVRTTLKQHLSPNLDPLDYVIRGVLENKTNATSHPNIGSLKNVIEEEWNKISEEFIFEEWKSFRRRVDAKVEKKWWPY